MNSIKRRLFTDTLGDDVGNYLILNLARALSGEKMKKIMFGLGSTNTGKGILTKACLLSMGSYCDVFTGENLAFNNVNNDEAQKMRWAMLLRYKRLIISNELSTTKNLDGNLIKKLSSGIDRIKGREHGGNEKTFYPHYMAILLANDIPKIKPFDPAVQGRVKVYSMVKSFVDNPSNEYELKKDPNLDAEMQTILFQRCFIGLLIDSHLQYRANNCVEIVPDEVSLARDEWMGSNEDNNVITQFQEVYEITNDKNDYVLSKDIERTVTSFGELSYRKFAIELKKHCVINTLTNVKNDGKKLNKKVVQVWFGIKNIDTTYGIENDIEEI